MIVDGAHVSHDGIRMLLTVSEAPILLSHSNAYSLCDHPRNAPDDVLKRLKENGGVVMATFVPGFVSQAVRNWLSRTRDAYGKAPSGADPKAQLAEAEGAARPCAAGHSRRGRRSDRLPGRDSGRLIMSASARTFLAGRNR